MSDTDGNAAVERGRLELAELSNAMVRLYKELFGRGPNKVRSEYAGPDLVVCTLEDTLTPVERTLVELGEHTRLRETRQIFQYAIQPRFVELAEMTLGRKVRGFVSGMDVEADVASELFYLVPRDAPGS